MAVAQALSGVRVGCEWSGGEAQEQRLGGRDLGMGRNSLAVGQRTGNLVVGLTSLPLAFLLSKPLKDSLKTKTKSKGYFRKCWQAAVCVNRFKDACGKEMLAGLGQ